MKTKLLNIIENVLLGVMLVCLSVMVLSFQTAINNIGGDYETKQTACIIAIAATFALMLTFIGMLVIQSKEY